MSADDPATKGIGADFIRAAKGPEGAGGLIAAQQTALR